MEKWAYTHTHFSVCASCATTITWDLTTSCGQWGTGDSHLISLHLCLACMQNSFQVKSTSTILDQNVQFKPSQNLCSMPFIQLNNITPCTHWYQSFISLESSAGLIDYHNRGNRLISALLSWHGSSMSQEKLACLTAHTRISCFTQVL